MSGRAFFPAGVAFVLLLGALPARAAAAKPYNLVIIAVDGLRADHLPFYGYARQTAPHLAARAASAVIFDRAVSQATWTLPSFATLFTSRYPEQHGANNERRVLAPGERMLTEVLHDAGLRTAGFVGGHFLDPVFGFARGFDLYRGDGMATFRYFPETAPEAADWIVKNKDRRFFVFVHGNDVHPPFGQPAEGEAVKHAFDAAYSGRVDSMLIDYFFVQVFNRLPIDQIAPSPNKDYLDAVDAIRSSPRDIAHIASHYDDRILEADAEIEKVFAALKRTGHDKDTIVVLLSDHGFALGERGMLATAFHVGQEDALTRVPLVIWHPALAARRVAATVQLVDVAPTLLEMMGIPVPASFRGRSFAGLAAGKAESGPRYAFSTSSLVGDAKNQLLMQSVQDGRWKLIYSAAPPSTRLVNLAADPAEEKDASGLHPDVVARLLSALNEHLGTPLPL